MALSENHTRSKANYLGTRRRRKTKEKTEMHGHESEFRNWSFYQSEQQIENLLNNMHSNVSSIFSKAVNFCYIHLFVHSWHTIKRSTMEKKANLSTKCINICIYSSEFFQSEARGCVLEDITESLCIIVDIQVNATLSTSGEQPGLTIQLTCDRMTGQYND